MIKANLGRVRRWPILSPMLNVEPARLAQNASTDFNPASFLATCYTIIIVSFNDLQAESSLNIPHCDDVHERTRLDYVLLKTKQYIFVYFIYYTGWARESENLS